MKAWISNNYPEMQKDDSRHNKSVWQRGNHDNTIVITNKMRRGTIVYWMVEIVFALRWQKMG